jgi:hypothetical protein
MKANSYLTDLAHKVKAASASAEQERRRKLWLDALELRTNRAPVNCYVYRDVWAWELAGNIFKCPRKTIEADIEEQLLYQLWRAEHLPDDFLIDPAIIVKPVWPQRAVPFPWGLELGKEVPAAVGSYKPIPPLKTEDDLDKIQTPHHLCDETGTQQRVEQVRALIDGVLPIRLRSAELHWGPFEFAVDLRGMDDLLLDVYDRPDFVHRLMDRITTGLITYHRERETAGAVDAEMGIGHVPSLPVPATLKRRLKGSWAYIHAQSSASYSPAMYEEFVHPYNCRLAELVGKTYYHGCEDLSQKFPIIRSLPALRLFHVSPWTPPAPVVEGLGRSVAYEVHSHPTTVVLGKSLEDIRAEIVQRHAVVKDVPHIWALADIETFANHYDRVVYWANTAKEFSG